VQELTVNRKASSSLVASPPLMEVFRKLFQTWGPQHWWPGRTRLEIIVGAILTQNTNWANVEKAITNLRRKRLLSLHALLTFPESTIAQAIRPAGYYNQKAKRLKAFASFLERTYGGSLRRMFSDTTPQLRQRLLSVPGIGPETADSILLYAGRRPVFVVDAYTRRVMQRHGWIRGNETYEDLAALCQQALPADVQLLNELHALLVRLGKTHCRTRPRCPGCPLEKLLPPDGPLM